MIALEDGNTVRLIAKVRDGMDVTLTVEADLQNMTPSRPLPCTLDLSGQRSVEVVTLRLTNPEAAWRYRYDFVFRYGGRQGRHDPSVVYELPYRPEQSHRVIQCNFGKLGHEVGSQYEYAVDFDMPVQTTVCAARAGVVCGTRADSAAGGPEAAYKECANYVIIRHSDGTYAEYFHLSPGGARVEVGERVTAGQPIALSGNTGYTDGPHLHFSVFRVLDGRTRETLPVRFRLKNGASDTLLEGRSY